MKKRHRKNQNRKSQFQERLAHIKLMSFWARHAADQADAKMREVNFLLRQLGETGWIHETVILGPILLQRPYAPRPACSDAGQIVQAALCAPDGIGVVLWDGEEYAELKKVPGGPESEARVHLQPFEECEPALKALLLPHIEPLIDRLFIQMA